VALSQAATNLEPAEQDRRDQLLAQSPQREQAYDLREELTTIFDTTRSKAAGIRPILAWRQKVVASGLACFDPFLKLLDTWLDRIANYFRHHQSSGFVEGLNNKLKVLKRRCYGIYNPYLLRCRNYSGKSWRAVKVSSHV